MERPATLPAYCLHTGLDRLAQRGAPPWAPRQLEVVAGMQRPERQGESLWCMAEVDIFADLSEREMQAIASAAPMRSFAAGEMVYAPPQTRQTLFILKQGRVRIFRISAEGRALTTAIISPGTIFGEMLLLGQQMHDNYAEALDPVVVCVMRRGDVQRLLLSDARIATRIAGILGQRISHLERRLSDTVFKSVPQRLATTLCLLAAAQDPPRPGERVVEILLTHEQLAALTGTSRETATKVLNEYAEQGMLRLGRGRVCILDQTALSAQAGE